MNFIRIPTLKSAEAFGEHIQRLGIDLRFERQISQGDASPLRASLHCNGMTIGNRWAVQPMEGWDGTRTGGISDSMLRRWRRFGESGAKLIWGGEAMAVGPDGRANPNQLILNRENHPGIAHLREQLIQAHLERYGQTHDLVIGFQLTHSGRFCRPNDQKRGEPRVAFRHPLLDKKFNVTSDGHVFTDSELKTLVDDYVRAAKLAKEIGADFVDIKHCHGYLLHEFLAAHTRPGPYGGLLQNRTRLLREIVAGIRAEAPGLGIGVRLSAFDTCPFKPNPALAEPGKLGPGMPEDFCLPYQYGFGLNSQNPLEYDLTETVQLLTLLERMGINLVNLSAGSPYYCPHIQRPAIYPPSDGYQPPEDPLVGVARQINVVKQLKAKFPQLIIVGSAYSYLQEYLPHVAEYYVKHDHVDLVGLGRSILSYPSILADATTTGRLDNRKICRTFSDCTTAPRNGLRSGCYPLDDFYKVSEDAQRLREVKKGKNP
ncbi:MAG: NADH:flavin oxidoreductase [Verrucomicrobia bacterium]|nr:MAG: NADH:flavin oxidoreductase [Verrucomicrobiota bacterium]